MSPGHLKGEGSGPGWPLASENYVTLCSVQFVKKH